MKFSQKMREVMKHKLKTVEFDVLVIGGGITGVGIALDATTRGMDTALVEMQDFAAGTSSRSTKLIHGGLRYLKQFEVKMVAEVGREREIVYENGPHVTKPEWMLLPIHKGGNFGRFSTSIGLRVYDYLANVKKSERRRMLNDRETLHKEPLLRKDGLIGGGYYVEYRTDDARLTIEVAKAAVERGATLLNYTKVEEMIKQKEKLVGVTVSDQLTQEKYQIFAKKIINATGPWVDVIREKDNSKIGKTLRLTKGVHIVIDRAKFKLKQSIYFDTPDGRMIFAIPRGRKAYIGTTDTFYTEDPINPRITITDINYLINSINYMFPNNRLTNKDVESSWAGIRPLILEEGKDPSEISRKDEIWESESGLITIAGGKLTGYRKMAEMTVDLVSKKLRKETGGEYLTCQTKYMPISGGEVEGSKGFTKYIAKQVAKYGKLGFTKDEIIKLANEYGSNVTIVLQIIKENKSIAEGLGIPSVLFGKLQYALEHEMVATPIDFWNRRTGDLLFNIQLVERYKSKVLEYMCNYFQWNHCQKTQYEETLNKELLNASTPIDDNGIE
ncbi:glycerol-3-phosphate dehydrogenase/oxidase [Bacillus sp. 31A1R]|uniref:Glycerol-3-phosphate dehydrogenase n=1 Tax=Robertmurraya mangrovi TaxID=3098077 RepID=A0ABU5J362_9BACI|nr:glycerol-3-phosphate dehydrogenase/oxidase [Bacillus sp. 31A1R]MDZ5473801.1 glycerol-3-phosphate dehydrogenase/oxidase [Bacillus sp. 31A1R]